MRLTIVILWGMASVCCVGTQPASKPTSANVPQETVAVASNPAPDGSDEWLRPAKDYASTRFSELDQITPETVKQLGLKLTRST
jgi:glucose dehydrogenase